MPRVRLVVVLPVRKGIIIKDLPVVPLNSSKVPPFLHG